MTEIRVTYSGLISFTGGLSTIITGLLFTILLTRNLLTEEYGTWGLINGLLFYVLIIEPVISYWNTREVARNIESARTGLISNTLFSIGGMGIYFLIAYIVGIQANADVSSLVFSTILIPVMFVNRTLSAINLGWKPHVITYGRISLGIFQIIFGLLFIYQFNMGIDGVILSVFFAYMISIIVLFYYARHKIRNNFKLRFLKQWLKLSWLPLYPGIAAILRNSTIIAFTVITSSVESLAFWTASIALTAPISQTSLISTAVYSKLLQSNEIKQVRDNLTLFFYFALPITTSIIIFAKPGLFVLNPVYEVAHHIVVILAAQVFLNTAAAVFDLFLEGNEKVDIIHNSTFKDYIKSKLFVIPTIAIIRFGTYLIILISILLIFSDQKTDFELLIFWAYIALFTQLPFTVLRYILLKKNLKIDLDFNRLLKFAIISLIVFTITALLMDNYLTYDEKLLSFIPRLLLFVGFGIGSYLLVTCLIDYKTRYMFRSIFDELKLNKE